MGEVLISGYYGFDNAGDEAILESIILALQQEASEAGTVLKVVVLSANPHKTQKRTGALAIKRTSLLQIIRALRRCNLFISGGGGLLQDRTGAGLSILYYLGLVVLAHLLGKPSLLYAQGIGPVHKKINRILMPWVLNKVGLIAVRDTKSQQELAALGVTKPITVTVDPVFSLRPPTDITNQAMSILSSLPASRPLIGLSVREWGGSEDYLGEVAAAVDNLAETLEADVVLLPMSPQDIAASEIVSAAMVNRPYVVKETLFTQDILSIVSRLDLLIGVRLHSLIFAAICGVPLVGIVYDPKVASLLHRLELSSHIHVHNLTRADLYQQAVEVWQQKEQVAERLQKKAELFRGESHDYAKKVWRIFLETKKGE